MMREAPPGSPPGLVQWIQGEKGVEGALPPPPIGILEGHDSASLNPRRLQRKLGKLISTATFRSFRGALDNLPEAGKPPEADDPFGRIEILDFAQACHRSMTGGVALACLLA